MGLIVLVFLGLIVSVLLMISFIKKKESHTRILLKVSLTETATVFFILVSLLILYHDIPYTNFIISKLFLSGMVIISFFVFDLTVKMPRFEVKKRGAFNILNGIIHTAGIAAVLTFTYDFTWNTLTGFKFLSYMAGNISANRIITSIFLLVMPAVCIIIAAVKFIIEKSKIYRQQIIFYILTAVAMLSLFSIIYYITLLFSWMAVVMPLGYIFFIYFANSSFSSTVIYDKKQVGLAVLRFVTFILIFAVTAGFFASIILTQVRSFALQIVLLIFIASSFLIMRNFFSLKLKEKFGALGEYEDRLEKELQRIDYTEGRQSVLTEFLKIMKKNVKAEDLSILITDDSGVLQPVHFAAESAEALLVGGAAFDFVFENNISVLMRSQVLIGFEFSEIRDELIAFMDKTASEVLIFIREGQNFIGTIGLSKKRKEEAYTNYDFDVLSNLYAYFFLVAYYLRNIAKQDIILTVDREIEMSDQIIESVQKTMDVIENKPIQVDSASYTAHKLGGDFIDFIKLSESRSFFLIGDISGKGLSASMSMLILKSVLHTYLSETQDFKELVEKVNLFIKENLPKGTFFAGLFGIIDFKNSLIYYLNCGIPLMAMYIDSYKNVTEIQGEGRVLGFVKNIKPFLRVRKITMNKDDIIVFTTDGLLESENLRGDRFNKERVKRILSLNKEKTAGEIADILYKSLIDFVSHQIGDDVTILVFKHSGGI